jgi:hypothetical protein
MSGVVADQNLMKIPCDPGHGHEPGDFKRLVPPTAIWIGSIARPRVDLARWQLEHRDPAVAIGNDQSFIINSPGQWTTQGR